MTDICRASASSTSGGCFSRRAAIASRGRIACGAATKAAAGGLATCPSPFRFHLHYALRLQLIRNCSGAVIAFPTGELWLFEAGGLPIEVEESIFFASAEGPRRIEQLVIRGNTREVASVAWSFSRNEPG